jgi:hypothetical protein
MSGERIAVESRVRRFGIPFGFQFSLAELFLVALYACVGLAAAMTGGLLVWLFAEATIVLAVAFVVAAIFARRSAQTFAAGFAIGVAAHAIGLFYFGASEFDPEAARLPFSRTAALVWSAIEAEAYVSQSTGEDVPQKDVRTEWVSDDAGRMRHYFVAPDGAGVEMVERPSREDFMLVAHALGSAGAGYLMGKLAMFLVRRRERCVASTGVAA